MNARPHRMLFTPAAVAIFAALLPTMAVACLWDYDTLRQERSRFPEVLELITGKFLRHSPEFYEWRIRDRLEKLKADPDNLHFHDDLAVAYSKVGRTNDAIATMEAKEKLKPGVYETYSNLGTFYILAGDFEKGLPYIDKALAINPEAHFGREKYQKWLVEHALTKRDKEGKISFPLHAADKPHGGNFLWYLDEKLHGSAIHTTSSDEVAAAINGVLGMMRFADYANPLLLEALGDLLLHMDHGGDNNSGQRLAARAYLQASYQMKDPAARESYRKLANEALMLQKGSRGLTDPHPNIEDDFRAELAEADQWYSELREQELSWIRDRKNADEEFDRLYDRSLKMTHIARSEHIAFDPLNKALQILVGAGVVAVAAIGLAIYYFVRRSRNRAAH